MFMYQIYTFHHTRATRLQGLICCILPLLMLLLSLGARAIEREPDNGLKLKVKADQYFQNEQFSEALSLYTQALEAAQADEDRQTQLRCLGNIGNVYAYMSDYDRAYHYFKKVYKMAQEDRNTDIELKLAINLTQVCCLKGDPQEARQWYKVQMELPYPNTPLNHYYALANKSFIAKTEGSYGPALFYQQQALKLAQDENMGVRYETLAHQEIGSILFKQKQYARAIDQYKRSYALAHKAHDHSGEISVCQDLFVAYRQMGDSATEAPTERHAAVGPDDEPATGPSAIGLSEEQATRLLEKVNSVLEDVSVISREDFSLAMLAKMVDSNTKYVSMVINDTYGKNFKTYLNEFRIREACRRLSDTAHYGNMTIQAIYEQLGYKTASSFVAAFRKIIGTTPSQYQKWAKEGKQAEG